MKRKPANSRVQHGDPACADYGCKLSQCLKARHNKQKRNKFLRDTGRPGLVQPTRAAAHLAKFRLAGFSDNEILAVVPVARNTFYRVMRGEPLTRGSEQKILSVPAPAATGDVRTLATVGVTGTHRRLRALVWLGWPPRVLEDRLGVHVGWIDRSFQRKRITQAMEARTVALYDQLWRVRPDTSGVQKEKVEEARSYARARQWQGPLAWDDDTIDDPNAHPLTDAVGPVATQGRNVADRWLMGESVILGREERRQVLQHLFEWTNDTTAEIADRLEMTPSAAQRQWERIKEKAAAEGRRVWRRVYIPRERDLSQNQMEEAA
ncbi:hypothetical protein [Streptomyces sp. NPDC047868]|uniref:hypothetical protein n=1 Tax=Streptomyces sp. NPDC047868 TaxID=3155480 RepID=UPI0034559B1B